jgi:hypothetical protein
VRFPVRPKLWCEAKVTLVCTPILVGLWYGAGVGMDAAVMPEPLRSLACILGALSITVSMIGAVFLAGFVVVESKRIERHT